MSVPLAKVCTMDWQSWHDSYDHPDSPLAARLRAVQEQIRRFLDTAPPGPLTAVSLCAGQGRDLLPVLAEHPRRDDVRALLVELDDDNAAVARAAAPAGVEVLTADASRTDHYAGHVPADLVLLCGIFGNIPDRDIQRTVAFAPQLTASGGTVVWTRHRREPDLVPTICSWFEALGFERVWVSDPGAGFGLGVHRHTGAPVPLRSGETMFRFMTLSGSPDSAPGGHA